MRRKFSECPSLAAMCPKNANIDLGVAFFAISVTQTCWVNLNNGTQIPSHVYVLFFLYINLASTHSRRSTGYWCTLCIAKTAAQASCFEPSSPKSSRVDIIATQGMANVNSSVAARNKTKIRHLSSARSTKTSLKSWSASFFVCHFLVLSLLWVWNAMPSGVIDLLWLFDFIVDDNYEHLTIWSDIPCVWWQRLKFGLNLISVESRVLKPA